MEPKITPEGDETIEPIVSETPEEEIEEEEPLKIDYEAIRKQEEDRTKPDPELAKIAFMKREEKRKEHEEIDEDKPITKKELQEIIAQNTMQTQKILTESQALAVARANTSSESEAQAAITFWKTRIISTGNIEDDIVSAIMILNKDSILAKNRELARAVQAKPGISINPASSHKDTPEGNEPKLSSQDTLVIKQSGYVWDGKLRFYKKQLGKSDKYLYFDPKSKKNWTA